MVISSFVVVYVACFVNAGAVSMERAFVYFKSQNFVSKIVPVSLVVVVVTRCSQSYYYYGVALLRVTVLLVGVAGVTCVGRWTDLNELVVAFSIARAIGSLLAIPLFRFSECSMSIFEI
jgi:hypothetical protein